MHKQVRMDSPFFVILPSSRDPAVNILFPRSFLRLLISFDYGVVTARVIVFLVALMIFAMAVFSV